MALASKPFCDWTQTLPCELLHSGDGYTPMPGFETGALYRELRIGEGDAPSVGDKVCCDWAMYTFYLSHVVSARGLTKGGAFEGDDVDATFLRFTLGDGSMIGAVEGALLSGMRVGGVRRVIIFPGAASYPGMLPNDKGRNWSQLGPAPETLSGRRSLDFVAKNTANVDKSLLMDIELLGVGEGARAVRGPGAWTPEALAAAKTGSL
eukprot:PRCOL_00003949-RA